MTYVLTDKKDRTNKWVFYNDLQFKRSLLRNNLPIDTVDIVFTSDLFKVLLSQLKQFDLSFNIFNQTQKRNLALLSFKDNQIETKFLKYGNVVVDWVNHHLEFLKALPESKQYDLAIWFSIVLSAVQLNDLHAIRIKMQMLRS